MLCRAPVAWFVLGLAAAAAAGCPGTNQAPSVALLEDRTVFVGDQLVVALEGSDPDGDGLAFTATGLPEGAAVTPQTAASALLLWTPDITDAEAAGRVYLVTVDASDGRGGAATATFDVTVFPAYGVPTFDLPAGLVLNLAQDDDLQLIVAVKDDDATEIDIDMVESPKGAKLSKAGAKSALFYWKPDDAQRETVVHRVVFTGGAGGAVTVEHVLLVVLVNGEKSAGCAGTPPTVAHEPLADAELSGGPLIVAAEVGDADSVVAEVTLRWTDGAPDGASAYKSVPMTKAAGAHWEAALDPGAVPAAGKLIHYYLEARDNDDPLGVACDKVARRPKTGYFTLGVYPPGAGAGACLDDDAEPDDTAAAAPTLGPGTYHGRRLCGTAPDVLEVEVASGNTLTAQVTRTPAHGGVSLRLLDAGGSLLDVDESAASTLIVQGGGSSPLRVEIAPTGGAAALSYSLELVVSAADCPEDEFEPNDTVVDADAVGPGAYSDLTVCAGDEDWYRFELDAGERLDVAIGFQSQYGDLDLELWDATGTTQLGSAGGEGSTESLSWTSQGPSTVAARVRGYQGATNDYDLTVSVAASGAVCDEDVVGLHVTADEAVVLFSGIYQGLMACPEAPDWYALDLNGGETLTVLTESDAPVSVEIYDGTGTSPVASGATGGDDIAEATWQIGAQGRLYYRVAAAGGAAAYALLQDVVDPAGGCIADRFEPNDDPANAPLTAPGVHTWLRLCGSDDVDAFDVELGAFDVMTLFTGHQSGLGYSDLKVLDPTGAVIGEQLDYSVGAVLEVVSEVAGTYTVVVQPYAVEVSMPYDLAILVD